MSRDPLGRGAGGWGSDRHIPGSPGAGAECQPCRGGCRPAHRAARLRAHLSA